MTIRAYYTMCAMVGFTISNFGLPVIILVPSITLIVVLILMIYLRYGKDIHT